MPIETVGRWHGWCDPELSSGLVGCLELVNLIKGATEGSKIDIALLITIKAVYFRDYI